MKNNNGRITVAILNEKVIQLEKNSNKIDAKLDAIMENHLPHIQSDLVAIKTRMNVLTTVNIGAVIALAIINKFL